MPARNTIKQYLEDGYYHVYNRGVEKRDIFLDDQDYSAFIHIMKFYLTAQSSPDKHPLTDLTGFNPVRRRPLFDLHQQIKLLCFCLMKNHFHLLVKQTSQFGMPNLIRRLLTAYVMYFNRRYNRVGHLFQGTYKAALIQNDSYLLHLSRYIHLNPVGTTNLTNLTRSHLVKYPYSSYPYYLGDKKADWLNIDFIISFFKKAEDPELKSFISYKEFVEDFDQNPLEMVGSLALEEG